MFKRVFDKFVEAYCQVYLSKLREVGYFDLDSYRRLVFCFVGPNVYIESYDKSINGVSFFTSQLNFPANAKDRFFLLVGEPGYGKTTLLLNLLIKISKKKAKLSVKYFLLREKDAKQKLQEIESPESTIVLLDSLEESHDKFDEFADQLEELVELAKKFYLVIISARPNLVSESNGVIETQVYGTDSYLRIITVRIKKLNLRQAIVFSIKAGRYGLFKALIRSNEKSFNPSLFLKEEPYLSGNYFQSIASMYGSFFYHLSKSPRILNGEQQHFRESLFNFFQNFTFLIYKKYQNGDGLKIRDTKLEKLFRMHSINDPGIISALQYFLFVNRNGEFGFKEKSHFEFFFSVLKHKKKISEIPQEFTLVPIFLRDFDDSALLKIYK